MTRRRGLSPVIRFAVWRRDGFRCTYCSATAEDPGVVLEVDHVLAVAHGGTDDLDNLTTACRACNWKKGPRRQAVHAPKPPTAREPAVRMRIRNRVKVVRQARGLSVVALARLCGVSRQTLFKIDADSGYSASPDAALAICKALDDPELFWIEHVPDGDELPTAWTPEGLAYWGEWADLLTAEQAGDGEAA